MCINNKNKKNLCILILIIMLLPAFLLLPESLTEIAGTAAFEVMDKNNLSITLTTVNYNVKSLSAEPSNKLILKAAVRDSRGDAISGARITMKISEGFGSLSLAEGITNSDGSILLQYSPPFLHSEAFSGGNPSVRITAGISGTNIESSYSLTLIRKPVILIHGYKATPAIFSSMKEYLDDKGFNTQGFSYDSDKGVVSGAAELDKFIDSIKADYFHKGIQTGKLDLIAHSMGGLVARDYSCNNKYTVKNDVDKIIFISVPQAGSSIAELGLEYYNDKGINDLIPDSSLFNKLFPSLINAGLNSSIQVGSLLGQFDEVVSPESASLERWGIKTEMFDVGDSNFTIDKLLSGKIVEAANHKNVLFNKTVFQRVEEMLGTTLPYPSRK